MQKEFFTKNWHCICFNTLLLLIFVIFYGKFGNVIVDSFREAYIPEQIIKGDVLYRNIFTIYSPLSYLINAFLLWLFGAKLKILYAAGFITTVTIFNLLFKICNKFLPKTYGLGIILFVITTGVLSPNVFNFYFPYSYGIIYGFLFILASLYMILKRNYSLGYLFYSLAICSKYEFLLILPLILIADWKQNNFRNIRKNIVLLFAPILVVLVILFIQGISINDIIVSTQLMIKIASSKATHWYYSISGLIFRPEHLYLYFLNFVKFIIPILIITYIRNWLAAIIAIIICIFFADKVILMYAFPLILVLLITKFKQLNFKQKFIVCSSLIISLKVFWALVLQSYGTYFVPFALLSIFILIPKKFKTGTLFVIYMFSFIYGIQNTISLSYKNIKLETQKGIVYANSFFGEPIKELILYVQQNVKPQEKIVIFPECLIVNVMTERTSDNKLYSLIPLYTETFGENSITKRLNINKPEYVIINNYDTSDYYFKEFGGDYGLNIFNFIKSNYILKKELGNEFKFSIYQIQK